MSKKRKNQNRRNVQSTKQKQSNLPAILFFSISGVVIIALLVLFAMNSLKNTGGTEENRYDFTYEDQPSIGQEDAPVKIVEFGDYKCPACKDFQQEIFPQIEKELIDDGKVQFFYINYPFIAEDSVTAALVGEAVYLQDEEAFWDYYELVHKHQGDQETNWATIEFLTSLIADNLPMIDIEEVERAIENNELVAAVNEDIKIAAEANVAGTPSVFINGLEFSEWYSYEAIQAEVDRILDGSEDE